VTEATTPATFERRTAHEFARDWLRRSIVSGELPGGTRLVQADIAEQLAISTTPVREAFRDLAAEGLIELDPHRGAIVHGISAEEFKEIYSIRRLLEPFAIRLAAERISDDELAAAEALLEQMENVEDRGEWPELNRQFHAILTNASRSPRLISILKALRDSSALYVGFVIRTKPVQLTQAHEEHRRMFEACRDRNPEEAELMILKHLESTASAAGVLDTPIDGHP
jgi:DNA-binding GntR family transcriptional regulator